ncbi:MAG: KEOPS complex subunit Pcc1 [Candidatus Bathyarchaeota archaeon]|nr:KEOPS complex subunit Pcc1 [Candidatus Bathyarchaeota archaeon]
MLEAQITLEYGDEQTADAVAKAVSPDNFKAPSGLSIATARQGKLVLTEVKTEGSFATFLATIDDLLFCVSTAEKALRIIKQ